ncbi:MAG TPA: thermonuclease family protein [Actinomycetes bacterium]|nr:thermonuclease family protein [Actinomycetes bacterium]
MGRGGRGRRGRRGRRWTLTAPARLALACVVLAACGPAPDGDRGPVARGLPAGADARVREVVDGDTVVVDRSTSVRLIGVDTPETRHPDKPVQCFGKEASRHTAELLPPGTRVRLVADVEPRDRYGRTLAYVYRARDGLLVNAELVRDGYAQPLTIPPNVAHAEEFRDLARGAREAGRGLWGACGEPGGGDSAAGAPPGTQAGGAAGRCDPAYVGVCIPPPPPDLDCGDVTERRFRLRERGRDPHRFDGDGNGLGCG